jgi:hypothetical protein
MNQAERTSTPAVAGAHVIDCPACCLVSPAYVRVDEAEQLAGVHDHLIHRGQPTAIVRESEPTEAGQR